MVELKLKKTYHQSKYIFYFIILLFFIYYLFIIIIIIILTKQMHLLRRNWVLTLTFSSLYKPLPSFFINATMLGARVHGLSPFVGPYT